MATRTTTKAGNWNDVTVWDTGIPGVDDTAVVNHLVAITSNITFNILDNNSTITFDATARTVTIKDGGSIDNSGGTITHAVSNGDVTFKASAGVTNWTWAALNSGTWTPGTGTHNFENGSLGVSADILITAAGTFNFNEKMTFYSTVHDADIRFKELTTVNFVAGKTYTLGASTRFYLFFYGEVNAVGSPGNEVIFNGKDNLTYMRLEGTNSVDADFECCNFNNGANGLYIASIATASGDSVTIDNCNFSSMTDSGIHMITLTGTLTFNNNNFYSCTREGFELESATGIVNIVGGSAYLNSRNGYATSYSVVGPSGVIRLNRVSSFANTGWGASYSDLRTHSGIQIVDSLFRDNLAGVDIELADNSYMINCTIADSNSLENSLRVSLATGDDFYVRNTIISGGKYGINSDSTLDPTVTYSDIYGATTANYFGMTDQTGLNGNISMDPMFKDVSADNYDIQPYSPCINAGTLTGAPAVDINNIAWPNPNPEMGCYGEEHIAIVSQIYVIT